ncbi:hypothetical protein NON20_05810 [Synechocystis sp. B12]|nr:hypothetical protein NON20_05810 [Synechocystis sp. B12]
MRNHETPEPWQKEYYRKDGSRIPVLVGVASIDVELEYTVCIVVDMTEQQETLHQCRVTEAKLAELNAQLEQRILERTQSLQENEDRLKLAFNAAKMGYWDLDLLTNRIVWSESLQQMMGLKSGTFDADLEKVAQMMHPDDRALCSKLWSEASITMNPMIWSSALSDPMEPCAGQQVRPL